MPTSRSPKRNTNAPQPLQRPRFYRPLILIVVLAVLVVILFTLPASMIKRFLPPSVTADDFSGTLWHGSAGTLAVNSRNVGAIEWRIHPVSLLGLTLSADLHWVKVGFVADGSIDADRHAVIARNTAGGGPIEDLSDIGIPAGWHGTANFKFSELKLATAGGSPRLSSAVGDIVVSGLSSPQIAGGADLGGYALHIANPAIAPNGDTAAELTDTGGPLQVEAAIHFSAKDNTGMLSGTVKERADVPPALRSQLDDLAQLHPRDAQGRLPVDLEFTL